jgi:hypothetical protein
MIPRQIPHARRMSYLRFKIHAASAALGRFHNAVATSLWPVQLGAAFPGTLIPLFNLCESGRRASAEKTKIKVRFGEAPLRLRSGQASPAREARSLSPVQSVQERAIS